MRRKTLAKVLLHSVLVIFSAAFIYPILLTVTNSFMGGYEIINRYSANVTPANSYDAVNGINFVKMSLIPYWATLRQYFNLLFDTSLYLGLFFNSIKITLPIVAGQLLVSVPAAYAFEYARYRHMEKLFFVYVVIMILPLQVTLVPNYAVAEFLGINESYLAIILPAIFSPFGVFLIRQYLRGMPREYMEAARVDGASGFQAFLLVILPIVKSAIAALSMLSFVEYWNTVDQSVFFIREAALEPMSVYLSRLADESNMSVIFAASCFYMLPAVLIFLHGQDSMVEGIQLSGLH